jgi:hypothetical protein
MSISSKVSAQNQHHADQQQLQTTIEAMKRDLKLYIDKCTSVIDHNKKVTKES